VLSASVETIGRLVAELEWMPFRCVSSEPSGYRDDTADTRYPRDLSDRPGGAVALPLTARRQRYTDLA
jgi:hypothetical protein